MARKKLKIANTPVSSNPSSTTPTSNSIQPLQPTLPSQTFAPLLSTPPSPPRTNLEPTRHPYHQTGRLQQSGSSQYESACPVENSVEDEEDVDYDSGEMPNVEVNVTDVSGLHRKRGMTRLSDIWNLPTDQRIILALNSEFQPIDYEAGVFERFLGTMARKHMLCPLNYLDWRKVPKHYKDDCLKIIQSKFTCQNDDALTTQKLSEYALKSLGKKWRDCKADLKDKYFDESKSKQEMRNDLPKSVNQDQFGFLVDFWLSPEGKAQSQKNKRNRSKLRDTHTAGTKGYARHAYEMGKGTTVTPNRASLYIKFRTRKDGKPVNEYAAKKIRELKEVMSQQEVTSCNDGSGNASWVVDDAYSQVFGKERLGRVCGVGLGPTPPRHSHLIKEAIEERRRDKEKIRMLEQKVASFEGLEERISKQTEERIAMLEQRLLQQAHNVGFQDRDEGSSVVRQKSSCASHE